MTNEEKVQHILEQNPQSREFKLQLLKSYLIQSITAIDDELNPNPYFDNEEKLDIHHLFRNVVAIMNTFEDVKLFDINKQCVKYIIDQCQELHSSITELNNVKEELEKIQTWYLENHKLIFNLVPESRTNNYSSLEVMLRTKNSETSTTTYHILSLTTGNGYTSSVYIHDDFYKNMEKFDKDIDDPILTKYLENKLKLNVNELKNIDIQVAAQHVDTILRYLISILK